MKKLFLILLLALTCLGLAQPNSPQRVSWSAKLVPADARAGEGAQIVLTAKVVKDWHMYAPSKPGEMVEIEVKLPENSPFTNPGTLVEPELETKFDRGFKQDVNLVANETSLGLPVKLAATAKSGKAMITIRYQACDSRSCDAPKNVDVPVDMTLAAGAARPDRLEPVTTVPEQPAGYVKPEKKADTGSGQSGAAATDDTIQRIEDAKKQGLFSFILLAFIAGIAALATPCVWPMIPITVSFFSKKKEGQKSNLKGALWFGAGIISTFTLIGVLVSVIFGAGGVQLLAANIWVNLALGVLFVVLALNLFGVFEIVIPQALIGKAQGKTKAGEIVGPVAMGLVFSLTSFTCTVPFAGTVLASSATGDWFYPVIGMLSFSTAFALPFFLLALFPQWLAKLPKSGGWLVTMKAYMGFLELAAALKFFSNADLVNTYGLITREIFLSIWVAIFAFAGCYLLGWVKLPHDDETKIGWPRRIFGALNLLLLVFFFHGLRGGSLGTMTAFLPPNPYPGLATNQVGPIAWKHDITEGIAAATAENKLIFVNFTGVTCSNCRVMEQDILPTPEIAGELKDMVSVELYTDREQKADRDNAALRDQLTKVSTNPVYVVMTPEKKVIKVFQGLALSKEEFLKFLQEAKAAGSSL